MKVVVYVVVAIALLGGLFVLFRPDAAKSPVVTGAPSSSASASLPASSSDPSPTPPSTPPSASPPTSTPAAGNPIADSGGATLPEAAGAGSTIALVIAHGRLVSGPAVVRVKQNDPVVFHVTSDAADEMHLHGYNLHLALKPGKTATLEVRTTRVGRFTFELHHLDLELGALEVYPR